MLNLSWNILMETNFTKLYTDEQGRVVMPLVYTALQSGLVLYGEGITLDAK